ncbi:MAG TPA: hypothetical protein VKY74_05770 [Chloroflexia bacterium]|nr:hypothetical protein [Chloroflexia bacterium]
MTALPESIKGPWLYQAVVYTSPAPEDTNLFATAAVAIATSREEAEAIFRARIAARQHPFELLKDPLPNVQVHPLVPVYVHQAAGQETIYRLTLTALSEAELERLAQIPDWRSRWQVS